MQDYKVVLTGTQPLLMHADDIDWTDLLTKWREHPDNKKNSKRGDDRSPAWTWLGYTYHDGEHLSVPSANLMTCIREGATQVPVPGGKNKTFKAQSQSGIVCVNAFWPLFNDGKLIKVSDLSSLQRELDFSVHQTKISALGFELYSKRAKIGQSKHIRVRALFRNWQIEGCIRVLDDQITSHIFETILQVSGEYKGLCDWRPSSPKPGPYGTFKTEVTAL